MRHRIRARTATTVVVAVLAFGVSVSSAPAVGARVGTPLPVAASAIAWHGCSGGFRCGKLTVPVDDAAPAGSTIDLAVIRAPARDPGTKIGTLVFNPGGPGAPAVAFLRSIADTLPDPIRDRFDLVAFDPRGVGRSRTIDCQDSLDPVFDQSFPPETAAARAGLVDAVRSLAAACEARSGALLPHVSTVDTVRDLERLRVALGEEKLSFVGYSYGTYLGTIYASAHPDRVRAFVLDGPIDPTLTAREVALAQARGFEHALDDFLADCAAHPGCAFHHDGDAAGAYDALRARAARRTDRRRSVSRAATLNETRFDAAVLERSTTGAPPGRRSRVRWPPRRTATRRRCSARPTCSSVATAPGATTTRSRRSGRSPASTVRPSVTSTRPPRSRPRRSRSRRGSVRSS